MVHTATTTAVVKAICAIILSRCFSSFVVGQRRSTCCVERTRGPQQSQHVLLVVGTMWRKPLKGRTNPISTLPVVSIRIGINGARYFSRIGVEIKIEIEIEIGELKSAIS